METINRPAAGRADDEIRRLVARVLGLSVADVGPDLVMGAVPQWDSFAHANVLMEVERTFGFALDMDEAIGIESVRDLIAAVSRRQSNQ